MEERVRVSHYWVLWHGLEIWGNLHHLWTSLWLTDAMFGIKTAPILLVIFALRDDVMASLTEIWVFVKKQDYSNEGACFYPNLIRSPLVAKPNQWVKVKEKIIQQEEKKAKQTVKRSHRGRNQRLLADEPALPRFQAPAASFAGLG